jgi:predicted phage terminase large subunit-like protein
MDNPTEIEKDVFDRIAESPKLLLALAGRSFEYFFLIFFPMEHKLADFHYEFFRIAQDDSIKCASVMAFRFSGKSTILNTAYIIWAIMGSPKMKFIVLASQTQRQAQMHLRNIRREIEANWLLRKIFGPFQEGTEEWRSSQLVIPKYNAMIVAMSVEESKRGIRYGTHRPDLIVVDDAEDLTSTQTQEGRDKIYKWLTGELVTIGDENTKIVYLGNIVHNDAALVRIEQRIKSGATPGVAMRIPIVTSEGISAWRERFPDQASLDALRQKFDPSTWHREFLLKPVPLEEQIIKPEDIQYYDEISEHAYSCMNVHGVDLAISQKETADYTAIVSGVTYRYLNGKQWHLCITPGVVNRRMDFKQTVDVIHEIRNSSGAHLFFVEAVGYQQAAIETLQRYGVAVTSMRPVADKTARLTVAASFIKDGTVRFPRRGCELILNQLYDFGSDNHDDMVDALVYLILGTVAEGGGVRKVVWL